MTPADGLDFEDSAGFEVVELESEVVAGLAVLDSLNAEYEEGPDQDSIRRLGNEYLRRDFPRLDYVRTARIVAP